MFTPYTPRLLTALLTGVLIVLAFPQYGFEAGIDHLIWISLVPLILAAKGTGWRRGLLLGAAAGVIVEGSGFLWILLAIRRFTLMPWALASFCFLAWLLYSSIPWVLLGAALGQVARARGLFWVLAFWVGLEHYYPRLFPWHLGGALYGRTLLLQGVDLLGASGLTALVFWVNISLCLLLRWFWPGRGKGEALPEAAGPGRQKELLTLLASLTGAALLLLGALSYGAIRLPQVERIEREATRLKVALVQGALPPFDRDKKGLEYYLRKTRDALEGHPVDLVVWPEGADSYPFDLTAGGNPWVAHVEEGGGQDLRSFPLPLVTGAAGYDFRRFPHESHLAAFLQPGKEPLFYEKNIRMPFGEVVPFIDRIPQGLLDSLGIKVGTIRAGTVNPIFRLGPLSFRNLICYEAVLPDYVREASKGADFLVNITEDIWYGRTAHIPQHVSVLFLRVVENRTPLIRCTNIGPSGVLDITGRFHRGGKLFEPEVVFGEVKAARPPTVYGSIGRFFPLALFLLFLFRSAVLLAILQVKEKKGKRIAS